MDARDIIDARITVLQELRRAVAAELLSARAQRKRLGARDQLSLPVTEEYKPTPARLATDRLMRAALGGDVGEQPPAAGTASEGAASPPPVHADHAAALLTALDGEFRTRGDLEKRAGLPDGVFPKLMKGLLANGIAEDNGGEKRGKKYRLKEESRG